MKHYWRYQFAGWFTLLVLDCIAKALANMLIPSSVVAVVVLYSFGLLASHCLRFIYKKYFRGFPIWLVIPAALFLTFISAAITTSGLITVLYFFEHPLFTQQNPQTLLIFQHNLFLMWLFLFIWTGLYLFITRQRQVNVLNQQHLLMQTNLEQSQLHALLNQLNPHFMFNCINNIRALILEDTNKAREMLAHMADMLRYNLQDNQQATATIKCELDIVHAFIQLASIQFENRLSYSQNIETNINQDWLIPRMAIQLLLENALKHGIAKLTKGGQVSLNIYVENHDLLIKVSNHGQLHQQSKHGIGLQNIRTRLHMLYGNQASFNINQLGDFVLALIAIPLNKVTVDASHHY